MHQVTAQLIFDVLGWLGALFFLIAYFLLITKKWQATSLVFHCANIAGGLLLGASAIFDHSYPSAFINLAWAGIAVYGLFNDNLRKS